MTVKYFLSKFLRKQKISLSGVYRTPDFSLKELKNSLKPVFDSIRWGNKDLYLVVDYNISVLDYENNVKAKKNVNFAFQNSLTPLIHKPINATVIDHILTNACLNRQIDKGIIKTEISDHFPIFLITDPITLSETKSKRTLLYKRTKNTAIEHLGKKNLGLY